MTRSRRQRGRRFMTDLEYTKWADRRRRVKRLEAAQRASTAAIRPAPIVRGTEQLEITWATTG